MSRNSKLVAVLTVLVTLAGCSRSARFYREKGDKLAASGKYYDAALNYRKAIQTDARDGEAFFGLGSANLQLRKSSEAYQALVRAVELLPARDDIKVKLADFALSAFVGDRRRPAKLYEQVVNLADQLLKKDARSYDGLRLKAYLAITELRFDAAKDFFRRANEVKPMQPQVIVGWTKLLFQGKENAEGERLAFQLIDREKTNKSIYDVLYAHYMVTGSQGEAEKILKLKAANNAMDAASVLELAAYYANNSKADEMKAVLQRILDNSKAFPHGYVYVGDFYSSKQRWDEAIASYELGAKAHPKEKIVYQKRIAYVWLSQGKGEQAAEILGKILQQQPGDDAAQGANASLLLASGNQEKVQQAVSQFQSLVDKIPSDAVWHFNLGRALAAKGDLAGARGQFQEAIQKRADFVTPRLALARLSQSTGDMAGTLRYANEALKVNPYNPDARLLRAMGTMNTDAAAASAQLTDLDKAYPRNQEVQFQLAVADLRQKKFKEANDRLQKILWEYPGNVSALRAMVQMYRAQNQPDRMLPILEEQLKKSQDSDSVRLLLAQSAESLKKYDVALEQYQRLATKNPKSEPVQVALGQVYQLMGDVPKAIGNYQKALDLAPKDPQAALYLGDALAVADRKTEALAAYRHALEQQPDNPMVLNNLAFMIAESGGSLDEALKLAQKAIGKAPKQPNIADTLGWIYLKKNLNDSAVQVFRGLTHEYRENPTFHYHLGLALIQIGDRTTAKAEFNMALSQKPSAKIRGDIQAALAKIG
jgi:tetratricopeptide (TPR) repeat protein